MRENPAEIKVSKWDRSKTGMTLKEMHRGLWHLSEEIRRQRKSFHSRGPAVLALKCFFVTWIVLEWHEKVSQSSFV